MEYDLSSLDLKREVLKASQLHSLVISLLIHSFSCDSTLSSRYQCCNRKPTTHTHTHTTVVHNYRAMLEMGIYICLQI